jgi:hypothetical protein
VRTIGTLIVRARPGQVILDVDEPVRPAAEAIALLVAGEQRRLKLGRDGRKVLAAAHLAGDMATHERARVGLAGLPVRELILLHSNEQK